MILYIEFHLFKRDEEIFQKLDSGNSFCKDEDWNNDDYPVRMFLVICVNLKEIFNVESTKKAHLSYSLLKLTACKIF